MLFDQTVTRIQATWRGHLVRRNFRVHSETDPTPPPDVPQIRARSGNRRLMAPPRTPPRGNSEKFTPKEVLPQSTKIVEKVPFSKAFDLDIVVDGAVGLPMTTTVVRLQAELHMPTKEILEVKSQYSYSDLTSEFTSPQFPLRMQWKGKDQLRLF